MISVAIYSVAGAPGVSTLVAAMAATTTEQAPLLVVEAGPGGGVVAARSQWSVTDSVATAAMDTTGMTDLVSLSRPWLSASRVVCGHPSPVATMHAQVGQWLADRIDTATMPLVIDGGRLGVGNDQLTLAATVDRRWLLIDPTRSQATIAAALQPTLARLGPVGLLVAEQTVGPGRWSAEEAAATLGWPLVATVPHDPAAAAALCGEAPAQRALRKSALLRTAVGLTAMMRGVPDAMAV